MLTRPRITRALGVTAVASLALLTLSACLSVKADMTINADAKATGTLSLEFEKQAANFLGINSVDDFTSGITDDKTAGNLASLTDCSASENDTAYVYSCTFADQEFATEGEAPWTITKQGNTIVMKVVNKGQTADAGSEDLLGNASLGTISISATFPGTITEVTGAGATKKSDTTVQIDASLTDNVDVTVVSEASSGGALSSVLVIVIFIAILGLIILVAIVLIMRRRGKSGDGADAGEVVEGVVAGAAAPAAAAVVVDATTDMGPVTEDVPAPAEQVAEDAPTPADQVTEDVPTPAEPVTEDVPPAETPESDDPSI